MIKSIRLKNFKCFSNFEVHFDKAVTYLNGMNGEGKSSIIEGIQLALLGYIPGHSKKLSDIFKFSSDKDYMSVSITYDNLGKDYTIKRTYTNVNGKISCSIDKTDLQDLMSILDADLETPIFNFKEFIQWSANKQKQWLLNFLQKSENTVTVNWRSEIDNIISANNLIPDELFILELSSELPQILNFLKIKECNDMIKDRIAEERAIQQSAENTLQEVELSLSAYSCACNDKEELSEELYHVTEELSKLNYYKKVITHNRSIQCKLDDYADLSDVKENDKIYTTSIDNVTEISNKIKELNEEYQRVYAKYKEIEYELTTLEKSTQTTCPILAIQCDKLAEQAEAARLNTQRLRNQQHELDLKKSDINNEISEYKDIVSKFEDTLKMLSNRYEERDSLRNSMIVEDIPDDITESNIDEYIQYKETEKENLHDRLNDAIEYSTLVKTSKSMENQKIQSKIRLDLLKALDKLTGQNGLQAKLGKAAVADFLDSLSKTASLFYKNSDYYIDVENEKSNSFDFGIVKDGNKISYDTLSSGEQCVYMVALLSAILKLTTTCKLLLIDDVFDHLDEEMIKTVIKFAESQSDIQYIFAGYQTIAKDESLNKYVIDVKRLKE